jgi:hypothetical protein
MEHHPYARDDMMNRAIDWINMDLIIHDGPLARCYAGVGEEFGEKEVVIYGHEANIWEWPSLQSQAEYKCIHRSFEVDRGYRQLWLGKILGVHCAYSANNLDKSRYYSEIVIHAERMAEMMALHKGNIGNDVTLRFYWGGRNERKEAIDFKIHIEVDYVAKITELELYDNSKLHANYTRLITYYKEGEGYTSDDFKIAESNPQPLYVGLKLLPHDMIIVDKYLKNLEFQWMLGGRGRMIVDPGILEEDKGCVIMQPSRSLMIRSKWEKFFYNWGWPAAIASSGIGLMSGVIPGIISGSITMTYQTYSSYQEALNSPIIWTIVPKHTTVYVKPEELSSLYVFSGEAEVLDENFDSLGNFTGGQMLRIYEDGELSGPEMIDASVISALELSYIDEYLTWTEFFKDASELDSLTLKLLPETTEFQQGDHIRISGRVTSQSLEPVSDSLVYIKIVSPKNYRYWGTKITDLDGYFNYSGGFTDDASIGEWLFTATVRKHGYSKGTGLIHLYVEHKRKHSQVSITLKESEIVSGELLKIEGDLSTGDGGEFIELIFIKPDKSLEDALSITGSDGTFVHSHIPLDPGKWEVKAVWEGNSEYVNSSSEALFFTVTEKEKPDGILGLPVSSIIVALSVIIVYKRRKNFPN